MNTSKFIYAVTLETNFERFYPIFLIFRINKPVNHNYNILNNVLYQTNDCYVSKEKKKEMYMQRKIN